MNIYTDYKKQPKTLQHEESTLSTIDYHHDFIVRKERRIIERSSNPKHYPPGTIVAYGSAEGIPEGWLLCNGDQYDKNDTRYRNLFNAIQTTWGGDGNPFFKVPDLHGLFLRATESRTELGTGGGSVDAMSGTAEQDRGTDTYEGRTGGDRDKRVPGLAHRHKVKMEPPYKYVLYIIKL